MSFIVQGPGLHDPIPANELYARRVVEPSAAIAPARPTPGTNEEPLAGERSATREQARLAQAYDQHAGSRDSQPGLEVRHVMTTPVVTITPEATLEDAWQLFTRRRFRHVPVCRPDEGLVGIVSDRSVLRYVALGDEIKHIGDVMATRVLTATPETILGEAARVLLQQRIGALPIMADGELVGIVTRSDCLRVLVQHPDFEEWV